MTLSSTSARPSDAAGPETMAKRHSIAELQARLRRTHDVVSPAHHILYNLLRGLDARRGFATPLHRGSATHGTFERWSVAVHALASAEGLVLDVPMSHALGQARRQAALADFFAGCGRREAPALLQLALTRAMKLTPHGDRSDTLAHGTDVWVRYQRLCDRIRLRDFPVGLPAWLAEHGPAWVDLQVDPSVMREYLVHHDCGKASVMTCDTEGRRRFPDHAQASAQTWALAGGSHLACQLMAKDMLLHTCPPEQAAGMATDPLTPSLLFAAFAELKSNAESVFGGLESTSYKIKLKALTRRAHALCRAWSGAELKLD